MPRRILQPRRSSSWTQTLQPRRLRCRAQARKLHLQASEAGCIESSGSLYISMLVQCCCDSTLAALQQDVLQQDVFPRHWDRSSAPAADMCFAARQYARQLQTRACRFGSSRCPSPSPSGSVCDPGTDSIKQHSNWQQLSCTHVRSSEPHRHHRGQVVHCRTKHAFQLMCVAFIRYE